MAQEDDDVCPLWDQMVHQWETHKKKDPLFIRDMVRKGIPSHYRGHRVAVPVRCTTASLITGTATEFGIQYLLLTQSD